MSRIVPRGSFSLPEDFLAQYRTKRPKFGPLGEFVYKRTYAAPKEDGVLEDWWETVKRVVEGTFQIQRGHCERLHVPWDLEKAQSSAQEMYKRMFEFKFLPPGRGLARMGTEGLFKVGGACLNNCGFISTENLDRDLSYPFRWLLEMSFLGVGVGFDTEGAGKVRLLEERLRGGPFLIPDTREGWSEYLGLCLESMVNPEVPRPDPDYSSIRPRGTPIKTFGGVASGPEALKGLTKRLDDLYEIYKGKLVDSRFIVDVANCVGECVISGGTRRTAEIAFGKFGDDEFLRLKDYKNNPDAAEWPRWVSNNSFFADSNSDFSWAHDYIVQNGEPGLLFLENAQKYGRMIDPPNWKDRRAKGANPCVEQTLEHSELCCLVETFPSKHEDLDDYKTTLKFAYLYAKTVTLVPTHNQQTNAVMMRNRRIGCSQSGIQDSIARLGVRGHMVWCDEGYKEIQRLDRVYSDWLCVPRSIKTTSVKPSGTVSKLAGVREGIHESKGEYEYQTVRVRDNSPLLAELERTNHRIVDDPYAANTKVVYFAAHYPRTRQRTPTMWEQLELAALMQAYWADNQVSVTIDFDRETEGPEIAHALDMYAGRLKGLSFLPREDHGYHHAPKQVITKEEYEAYVSQLGVPNFGGAKTEAHDREDKFCDGEACEIDLGGE
ncbi:MAG: fused protease/ribonucleoside-triphosphate reductase [Sphaerospermopsis sp. SIO1G2]|nr:fused protease/ribonucleoside-triphosphate reductase [Sphaerospermopsis sp. SIO1G2]